MTLSERRYYRFAVLLSLIFHGAVFLIHFAMPQGFLANPSGLETMAPSILDLPPGSPYTQTVTHPQSAGPRQSQLRSEQVIKVKPESQSEIKPAKPQRPAEEPVKDELKIKKPKKLTEEEPKLKSEPEPVPIEKKQPSKLEPSKKDIEAKAVKEPVLVSQTGAADGGGTAGDSNQPPVAKNYGSGEQMVAAGLNLPIFYPKNAQNEGKEGDVVVRVLIAPDGTVEKVAVVRSSGDSRLDQNAVSYGRKLKFKANPEKYYVEYLVSYKINTVTPLIKFLRSESRL